MLFYSSFCQDSFRISLHRGGKMLLLHNFVSQFIAPFYEAKSCHNTCSCSCVPYELRFPGTSSLLGAPLKFTSQTLMPCIRTQKSLSCFARARDSDQDHNPKTSPECDSKSETRSGPMKGKLPCKGDEATRKFPTTIPRKPRRGRKSEAVAVEDFIRDSLERTFSSIRQQNPETFQDNEKILKEKMKSKMDSDNSDDEDSDEEDVGKEKKMLVEEEDPNWPLDADVGWGIRASEYFEQHPIKNVAGEDGVEIDWEGELDDNWVKEINCLEWEEFAFHPSPLVVLVFERYNRASDNWRALKELEKAIKVYWNAKDRLPPRLVELPKQAVKIDVNIERDLSYALKVKECPQILFLGKNRILYREKEIRTADELVQMIAHFYYNAKRPSWIDDMALKRPF